MSEYSEIFLRTTLAFVTLFFLTKLLGKKLISQMTYFDYIAGITLGTLSASMALESQRRMGPLLLALILWGLYSFSLGLIALKYRKTRRFIESQPTVLVENGKIMEENMARKRFDLDDLMMKLREKNIFNLGDVEFAILETDGQVSVIPKSQKRPVTPADLKIPTSYEGLSIEIIMDGKIVHSNLKRANLDVEWLKSELQAQNVNSVLDVDLAQLSSDGNLYIDLKSDALETPIDPAD